MKGWIQNLAARFDTRRAIPSRRHPYEPEGSTLSSGTLGGKCEMLPPLFHSYRISWCPARIFTFLHTNTFGTCWDFIQCLFTSYFGTIILKKKGGLHSFRTPGGGGRASETGHARGASAAELPVLRCLLDLFQQKLCRYLAAPSCGWLCSLSHRTAGESLVLPQALSPYQNALVVPAT